MVMPLPGRVQTRWGGQVCQAEQKPQSSRKVAHLSTSPASQHRTYARGSSMASTGRRSRCEPSARWPGCSVWTHRPEVPAPRLQEAGSEQHARERSGGLSPRPWKHLARVRRTARGSPVRRRAAASAQGQPGPPKGSAVHRRATRSAEGQLGPRGPAVRLPPWASWPSELVHIRSMCPSIAMTTVPPSTGLSAPNPAGAS